MIIPIYIKIYVFLVLSYLWYRFLLRFIADIKRSKDSPLYDAKMSVLIPVYNEQQYRLEMCIDSVIRAKGNKEVIVIDDCSTNSSIEELKMLKKKFPEIKLIRLKDNRGKRMAQYTGLKFITGDIIQTKPDTPELVEEVEVTPQEEEEIDLAPLV